MVTGTIREMAEENSYTKMVQLAKQGACIRWIDLVKQHSHRDIIENSITSLKFM